MRRLVDALEFDVRTGEEPSVESVQATVRGRLERSQGLVVVLTRRSKIEGTDEWLPPTWVHDELAIARTLGKPMAVFAEEGVRVEGIVPLEVKYERFDRLNLGASSSTLARYLVALRNALSPPSDGPAELATIRALCEELLGIASQLATVETSLETSGFNLSLLTARSTGRFYLLPEDLQEKVTAGYQSVAAVDAVLEETRKARNGLRSTLKGVILSDFSLPPLPADHPLRKELAGKVEAARDKVGNAWIALYQLGYPDQIKKMRAHLASMPPAPQKDALEVLLAFLTGDEKVL